MKSEVADAKKLSELLEKADRHPMMKAILAKEAAATLEKRTSAAKKIAELKLSLVCKQFLTVRKRD